MDVCEKTFEDCILFKHLFCNFGTRDMYQENEQIVRKGFTFFSVAGLFIAMFTHKQNGEYFETHF